MCLEVSFMLHGAGGQVDKFVTPYHINRELCVVLPAPGVGILGSHSSEIQIKQFCQNDSRIIETFRN